jgi:cysteine-S-conjugate beta-lyase
MECTDKYDFDTPIDRTNTQSLKWDVAENELPMWVADMDFKTAPEIIEAVEYIFLTLLCSPAP